MSLILLALTVALASCSGDCDHKWNSGSGSAASCTEGNVITYTCQKCGDTKQITTEAKGHDNIVNLIIPATCTADGFVENICQKCQAVTTEVLPKTAHSISNPVEVYPTCSTEGSRGGFCSLCSQNVVEVIPTRDHTFSAIVSNTPATCVTGGFKVYKCSSCTATKEVTTEPTGNHSYYTDAEHVMIKKAPTATTAGEKVTVCKSCPLEQSYPYTYAEYQADLNAAISKLQGVDTSAFGTGIITTMDVNRYSSPTAYPTVGEHPRLLINTTTLNDIRAAILRPENAGYFNSIIATANEYSSGLLGEVTTHTSSPKGEHNLNEAIYDTVMAKSLLYLLTGVETYAIDAIRMTKEFMSTIKIVTVNPDPERNWGYAMFTVAIVYDWCYDALSDQDKEDLVRGVEYCICKTKNYAGTYKNNMEISFPPSGQGAVCGHGSERQLLRDYLSIALAIYDEYPSWYEYIGGRFFQEYVPVRNEFYKAGMYPQGISVYIQIRFTSDLWSAWLMKSATGKNPYSDDMARVVPSLFSRIVDGGVTIFDEGDCEAKSDQEIVNSFCFAASISAYLYNDSVAASLSNYYGNRYTSALNLLILKSTDVDEDRPHFDGLDLICYNGGFMNEIVAHSDWGASAVSVLMKIGGRSTANHDHGDAGSFQIYYKGILAGDTGFYDTYNSTHFKNYHQATIAHNSIVIYRNGSVIGQKPGSSYAEPTTYERWMTDTYKTANLSAVSYGYKDAEKTQPTYAYIAGDISPAYQGNVTKADRRMLAVFDTQNPNVPLYFIVYDNVVGTNSSDRATFLLHTKSDPTISGNTVSAFAGTGKLILQNIVGGDKIEKIGGTGKNYVVNGSQVATQNGEDDGYWGRVEISPENSSKNDVMLNVMYVTDTSNKTLTKATKITGDKVAGATIGNTAAVFVEESVKYNQAFSFTTTGATNLNYYISGVKAGAWMVTVGSTTLVVNATEEGGLLTFNAPAGTVTVTPVG